MRKLNLSWVSRAVLLSLTATTLPATGLAATQYEEIPGHREFTGNLIVRPIQPEAWAAQDLDTAAIEGRRSAALEMVGRYELREHVRQTDEFIVRVPAGLHENDVVATLEESGLFQYAEPDWRVFPIDCPNDPRLGSQWHHDANRLDSCNGWSLHTGDPSVSVGICDTGVRTTHEDLQAHRLEGYNAVDREWEDQGGEVNDINGHGTMTTGCAAANGNNGKGVVGMGWNLSHRMLRVSNDPSGDASLSDLQHAARTAVENGDRVASVSYSGVDAASNFTTATYIKSIDGLLVWAAGNDGRYLSGDRDDDDLIVAGATDQSDSKASFSAYGPLVDLTAPGVSVYTTSNSGNSSYGSASGTSFSCPLTAGLCALIWSANPNLSPDDVELALKNGTDDLGSPGPDDTYGYGRINILGSLNLAEHPLDFDYPFGLPELLDPNGGTTVRVEVLAADAQPEPGTGTFFVDDGGGFVEYAMVHLGRNVYDAVFPAVSCGTNAHFYFSAETTGGETQTDPRSAPDAFYQARSALGLIPVFADDFQTDKGWTVENIDLADGPWERGDPVGGGERGDPADDYDGSGRCYLTDNVAGDSDVDGGPTRLTSPLIDMSAGNGIVRYARWFTNDDGDGDRLDVEISNDNGNNWTLVESVPGGAGWKLNSFLISDYIAPTGNMRLRFSATDNPNDSVTEAGLDAFEVLLIDCDTQPFSLAADPLIAGQETTLHATGATPDETVYFVYSTAGAGNTYVPVLQITLDMARPKLAGSAVADGNGDADFSTMVPPNGSGVDVWLQAAQFGRKTNLVETTIE